MEGYGHYHLEIISKDGEETTEVVIQENKDKHQIIDAWGQISGKIDKLLGEYSTVEEAVNEGVKILRKSFPNGQILQGAGCPPLSLIKEEQNGYE